MFQEIYSKSLKKNGKKGEKENKNCQRTPGYNPAQKHM